MITVVKETNYYHPDMHLVSHGVTQDNIAKDFEDEMFTKGVIAKHIREVRADGKEYITHISYTGNVDVVTEVCAEHDIIEEENAEVA